MPCSPRHTSPRPAAGVDVGGTFTDVVLVSSGEPAGTLKVRAHKVPTTPDDQSEGVAAAIAAAGGHNVRHVAHGTTTATNAVLERAVARTVLVTTEGFRDVLAIARQDRPSLYDLAVAKTPHLVDRELVVTVAERMGSDGTPVLRLHPTELARAVEAVAALRPEAVAISLLFSFAAPEHEQLLAVALAARLGPGVPITRSSELAPEFREYERTSTCVLNAAVAPVMRRYLTRLADRLPGATVTVMTSGGGTTDLPAAAAAPVHTLLSGPAAGAVAAAATARAAGYEDAVAFDMGGTSTDVCLIAHGRPQVGGAAQIGGLPFLTPAVAIHTVGAGGGSLAWLDPGGALRVGPRSAGARPGPACYGLGGTEPTVTDAHCALGHLDPEAALGGGALRLDPDAATRAIASLPRDIAGDEGAAAGVLAVARATMVRALRRVTTEQGVDPAGLALVAYGGAGPLHATALAGELGAAAVIVPPAPGVLSALGLLLAPPRAEASRTVMVRLEPGRRFDLDTAWAQLEAAAVATIAGQGIDDPELKQIGLEQIGLEHIADCRYAGQSHELRVSGGPGADLAAGLHAAHESAYGYANPDEAVEVVTLRVVVEGHAVLPGLPVEWDLGGSLEAAPDRERSVGQGRDAVTARVVDRAGLAEGDHVEGPAIVEQPDATTLLAPHETARVDAHGNLVIALGAGHAPSPSAFVASGARPRASSPGRLDG